MSIFIPTLAAWTGAAAALLIVGTLRAEEYAIDQMIYTNLGAYSGRFHVRWNTACGVRCRAWLQGSRNADENETVVVDLDRNSEFKFVSGTPETCALNEGDEVWGFVDFYWGESDSCRQSAKMRYRPLSSGSVTYLTRGTTQDKNRCRLNTKPTIKW